MRNKAHEADSMSGDGQAGLVMKGQAQAYLYARELLEGYRRPQPQQPSLTPAK